MPVAAWAATGYSTRWQGMCYGLSNQHHDFTLHGAGLRGVISFMLTTLCGVVTDESSVRGLSG